MGLLVTLIQHFTTVPLILHAEQYENTSAVQTNFQLAHAGHGDSQFSLAHSDNHDNHSEAWSLVNGWQRTLAAGVSTIIICMAFAMLLTACYALFSDRIGNEVDGRTGILWGLGGFAAFVLAPSLGLPAELPGVLTADISERQFWWVLAAVCTAIGIALMVLTDTLWLKLVGMVLILFPHAFGAPHPETIGGAVPPELAAYFAATSIVIGAVTWVLLGWVSGTLFKRLQGF